MMQSVKLVAPIAHFLNGFVLTVRVVIVRKLLDLTKHDVVRVSARLIQMFLLHNVQTVQEVIVLFSAMEDHV